MDFLSRSEADTLAIAADFAAGLKSGDVVALRGPLGAGKTLFCRGVARALGYLGEVASPTYALVQESRTGIPLSHLDLFRLGPDADWEEIGLDHYSGQEGICLIEWAERLPPERRRFTHRVELEPIGESERRIRISLVSIRPDPKF